MAERVIRCPQCHGPLAPSRFARSVVCSYCGATVQLDPSNVPVARFREAHARWNDPEVHGYAVASVVQIGHARWAVGAQIGAGEISDVYLAERARWPTELAILKVLRSASDADLFEREWTTLQSLRTSTAPGAASLSLRVPQPIQMGTVSSGTFEGKRVMLLRRAHGHRYTLEDVRLAHPDGVEARAVVWLWRRLLEVLSFVHQSGFVHAAVLPRHILIEDGEHGARLVGFSCADRPSRKLAAKVTDFSAFYPAGIEQDGISVRADLSMTARCMFYALGGGPGGDGLRARVPDRLRALIAEIAAADGRGVGPDAWTLRERVGRLSSELFGPPTFNPIRMPGPNAGGNER